MPKRRPRSVLPGRQERVMCTVVLDTAARRSPATMPGFTLADRRGAMR
jgi:hypothetical protein